MAIVSPVKAVSVMALSAFAAATCAAGVLSVLPPFSRWAEMIVDGTISTVILGPVMYLIVYRQLSREAAERAKANATLLEANNRLEARVQERTADLQRRNREISLLTELTDALQSCNTMDEASRFVARAAAALFPNSQGVLFLHSASRDDLEALATWGDGELTPDERVFTSDECWALRRGRLYRVDGSGTHLPCRHTPAFVPGVSLCIPLTAHGEVLGVLHLRQEAGAAPAPEAEESLKEWLAVVLAERVAVTLANLQLRETLRSQSIRDPLTGLFNRRYMEETLTREIIRSGRSRQPLAIVMLDLDNFKQFNDRFGHDAGDHLLQEFGTLLKSHVRGSDVVCRYGGEEFALIAPEASGEVIQRRMEAFRLAVKKIVLGRRGQMVDAVSVSIGIALFPDHGSSGEALLATADRALYQAKAQGRDRVVAAEAVVGTPPAPGKGPETAGRLPI